MNINKLKSAIDSYKDFPQEGIVFRDVLPILRKPDIFSDLINKMSFEIYDYDLATPYQYENYDEINFLKKDYNVAIITPDKDIIPGADTLNPAYIVFDNYEIILQWNRSLRFALAVCTLKDKFKNEL